MRLKLSIKGKTRLHGRIWTSEEVQFLKDHWEKLTPKEIAEKLDRTEVAIVSKAVLLGLPSQKELCRRRIPKDELLLSQLAEALNMRIERVRSWLRYRGLKHQKRYYAKNRYWVTIRISDFWEWARDYQQYLDLVCFRPNALGPEPDWMIERRVIMPNYRVRTKWSPEEKKKLKQLVFSYKYTLQEIARELGRSERSIRDFLFDENISARPLPTSRMIWNPEKDSLLLQLVQEGRTVQEISLITGIPEDSCYHRIRTFRKMEMEAT